MARVFPWVIALLAAIALMVSNGMSITGLPVYDEAIIGEFGWSRGELKFRDMVTMALTGLLAPFAGVLIDRYGVRVCMLVGWCVLGLAYACYGLLNGLAALYAIHAMLAIVLVFCGLNAAVILVSHWFVERRGTAIGLALVGTSLGGALFPQYGTWMIAHVGWREALHAAIAFPLVMFVLTLLVIRDRPRGGRGADDARARVAVAGIDYRDAIRTKTFWALAVIAMSTFYTVLGVQAHLFLYMRDLEFTPEQATNAISLFFLFALVGKFAFGFLADRMNQRLVFYGNILVMFAGSLLLAGMNAATIHAAVVAFGLGWGGVYTMIQLSAMNCFGLRAAGKILGTITILDALGGGLGMWLSGLLYESRGDYSFAFAIFAALIAVALICISQVKPLLEDGPAVVPG